VARSRVSLRFIPDEYDSFVRAIPNDPRLPATYDECRKRCLEEDAKTVANGEIVKKVVIHYDHFVKYCRDTGQQLSYELILAHAVAKASTRP
jgi:hypothetical protein